MSKSAWGRKTEDDVQENIDQAVDEAAELDFASLDEIREAFSE